jgi:hypothetical protein
MKKTKTNLLVKLVILATILYIFLLVLQRVEGFISPPAATTKNIVDIYFGINATTKAPIFISSTAPGINFVSSTTGVATLNIPASLGTLKDYTGFGWSTSQWIPINPSKLDRNNGTSLQIISKPNNKILHRPGPRNPPVLASSMTEATLPQAVSTINIKPLDISTFPVVGNGDPTKKDAQKNNAKIRIQLTF